MKSYCYNYCQRGTSNVPESLQLSSMCWKNRFVFRKDVFYFKFPSLSRKDTYCRWEVSRVDLSKSSRKNHLFQDISEQPGNSRNLRKRMCVYLCVKISYTQKCVCVCIQFEYSNILVQQRNLIGKYTNGIWNHWRTSHIREAVISGALLG